MSNGRFDLAPFFTRTKTAFEGGVDPPPLADIRLTNGTPTQVSGYYTVDVRLESLTARKLSPTIRHYHDITNAPALTLEITQGMATVFRDPYNHRPIIVPSGNTPVRARAILEATLDGHDRDIVVADFPVGIDVRNMAESEQKFERAGGGGCRGTWVLGDEFEFGVRVRASLRDPVTPLTLDERVISWKHGGYYAHDEKVGLMRIRYNPSEDSKCVMQTKAAQRESGILQSRFFPASGENNLFFVMEFLDLGFTLFNKEPVVLKFDDAEWPPYSVPLQIESPVKFYLVERPDVLAMTIEQNEMQIYDYNSLDVEVIGQTLDESGMLTIRWKITNQADSRNRTRWFLLGDWTDAATPTEGNRLLGPSGSGLHEFIIETRNRLSKSMLPQDVSMNVVSLDSPVMVGSASVAVSFPS